MVMDVYVGMCGGGGWGRGEEVGKGILDLYPCNSLTRFTEKGSYWFWPEQVLRVTLV